MKRRGFMPNIRTYATLMSGYASVKEWGKLTKQLEFVHSIYGELKEQLETSRDLIEDCTSETGDSSLVQYPIALYISILGRARKYHKAFDVFNDLDTNGPLAPHPKVYSALLCLSADRVDPDNVEATAQAVSDAKYIWRRHMRSLDKQPDHYIEQRSVDAVVKVLSRGEPSDHELMFDILRDICGLPRPGEDRPQGPPKLEPSTFILAEALDGCIAAGRPEMAVHYAQIAMGSPKLRPLLRVWHLPNLLRAHIALARGGSTSPARSEDAAAWIEWLMTQGHESDVPNQHALRNALGLCHHCGDMSSALRIARVALEGRTRASLPAKAWAYLLRLAIVAPPIDKRECLELLTRHSSVLDGWKSDSAFNRSKATAFEKDYVSLADCIVQLLRAPLALEAAGRPDTTDVEQCETWSDIRRRAESFLKESYHSKERRNGGEGERGRWESRIRGELKSGAEDRGKRTQNNPTSRRVEQRTHSRNEEASEQGGRD